MYSQLAHKVNYVCKNKTKEYELVVFTTSKTRIRAAWTVFQESFIFLRHALAQMEVWISFLLSYFERFLVLCFFCFSSWGEIGRLHVRQHEIKCIFTAFDATYELKCNCPKSPTLYIKAFKKSKKRDCRPYSCFVIQDGNAQVSPRCVRKASETSWSTYV